MLVHWSLNDSVRFGSALSRDTRTRYFLIVEQVPDQKSWDWIVWRRRCPQWSIRHGVALSAVTAMSDAQSAAGQWDDADASRPSVRPGTPARPVLMEASGS